MSLGSDDFVVPVDKQEGPTSHDIVGAARRAIGTRRIGHTGTLDPFASGLLLLCIGRATRLAEYLSGMDKRYEAVARLGVTTDTLDRDGQVMSVCEVDVSESQIKSALDDLVGTVEQVPPQFSAKKVDGVAMHRRARRGENVELPACTVTVYDIELLSVDLPEVRFAVRCSSGTYIRSIARDLGAALEVGAHLAGLRRTEIGSFSVADAIGVEALADKGAVARAALDPLDALAHLPTLSIDDEVAQRVIHGQKIRLPSDDVASGIVTVSHLGQLLAIAEVVDGLLKPSKVFAA